MLLTNHLILIFRTTMTYFNLRPLHLFLLQDPHIRFPTCIHPGLIISLLFRSVSTIIFPTPVVQGRHKHGPNYKAAINTGPVASRRRNARLLSIEATIILVSAIMFYKSFPGRYDTIQYGILSRISHVLV